MGRKSNRKKQRIEVQKAIEKEHNRQKLIAYLILFPGVALFIWGILLFDKTFIPTQTQVIITLLGATIGFIVVHFLWRHKEYGLFATLFFGFFLGGPIPFTFVATTNYYLRTEESENIELDILETGNRSRRKSNCRTPYVIVEHLDIKKDILFPCDYEKTISKYKRLTLTVSKGFWGYPVFINKKLND
ncbi:MAG: hypothetical protein MH132_13090 [Hydrotalea sp.]|nr:hypothetical protein [Hydrotalea sp.]